MWMISHAFRQKFESMANRAGVRSENIDSGHARWAVYVRAMDNPDEWHVLLDLVAQEPDKSLASAVVVRILELLPGSLRIDFVRALPSGKLRDYAMTRSSELSIFEKILTGVEQRLIDSDLDIRNWSTWLQLRSATSIRNESILDALMKAGSTKRVRHEAKERLHALRKQSHD
jgi:hypothetical protein